MTDVRKRSGKKEPFDSYKIRRSIQKAGIDAGYTLDDIAELVDEVTNKIAEIAEQKNEINTDAIRDNVLNQLDKMQSAIAESWRKFDRKYKP
jgi:transcriptional repressor NrdR